MDEPTVRRLIAAGETVDVEFKSDEREAFSDSEIVKNMVCLANGVGGLLLIGVEDDGRISGARARHESGRTDPARLQAMIANQTSPSLATTVSVIELVGEFPDRRELLAIEVEQAGSPVATRAGLYVRRAMDSRNRPQCVPYLAHEMLSRTIDNRQLDYAQLPIAGATWDDLDPLEFERYRRLAKSAAGDSVLAELSDVDIALALGVADRGTDGTAQPLAGAILLFGRSASIRRWVPTGESLFQVLSGSALIVDETWHRPLVAVAEEVLARLAPYNSESEVEVDLQRVAVQRLPTAVIREIIANALTHRDYTVNAPIVVQLKGQTLEVTSPGGLPPGVSLENLLTMTRPRSPILSDAFKRVGLVERSGRGVKRVYEALLQSGRRGPDYSLTNSELVHVTVPLAEGDLEIVRYFVSRTRAGVSLSLFDLQVLFELKNVGAQTLPEVVQLTGENEYNARSQLNALVEKGVIVRRDAARRTDYHLSPDVYRSVGEPGAYVRVHGFEAQQHEQMVLGFVRAHSSIARRDVAELCRLDPIQAGRLLARMAEDGLLVLRGEKRGAHYVLGPAARESSR